jgi:hypothetical protein
VIRNTVSSEFVVVSDDPIAERAHEIYVERGRTDGLDLDDWLQAEDELKRMPTVASRGGASKRGSTRAKKTAKHPQR